MFRQVDQPLLDKISAVVGEQNVLTQGKDKAPYLVEWRGRYQGKAAAIVRPGSTAEVASLVKLANTEKIALVPQGGNTGLVGGQIAFDDDRQIVLNLSRLNRIRDVDAAGYTMTVEAGVILENAQNAAREADRLFPLSLASEGSCQIGGNLSSNAGGTGVLAYGNARELTLGLEVVLPNGDVLNGLNKLRKNNTGYDLTNLFIGAEGTLGLITAAVLKLSPLPKGRQVAMVAFNTMQQAGEFFTIARDHAGQALTAFEIMPRVGIEFLVRHVEGARDPLASPYPWYGLIEISSGRSNDEANETLLNIVETGLTASAVVDGVVARSEAHCQAFWRLRHEMSGCQRHEGGSIKHDISVPVASLPSFMEEALDAVQAFMPGCRPVTFGHWGDGNIHFNISQPVDMEKQVFLDQWHAMNDVVHGVVLAYGGSISAEHGIGIMKRDEMAAIKDPVSLSLMKSLKRTLDPNGIMNPGKVISCD